MKKAVFFGLMIMATLIAVSCRNPVNGSDEQPSSGTGSINGKVMYLGGQTNAGITVSLDKTDGLVTEAVSQSVRAARSIARSVAGVTQTGDGGTYTFTELSPGNYTIYASSQDSTEKAVTTNVIVSANQSVTASDLNLTATGSLSGIVELDGSPTGNWGFFVSIAGTSYMAITDDSGAWKISDVPARAAAYQLIVLKGAYTALWDADDGADVPATVNGGSDTALGTMSLSGSAIRDGSSGLLWKGSLAAAPANPKVNWAYYNTTNRTSYIYDGDSWGILAISGQDGADGINGVDGTNGTDGSNGVGIIWKGTFASVPANPQLNWAYYNSANKKAYIYDGTAWQILAVDGQNGQDGQDGTDGVDGTNGTDGSNGIGIIWKGTFASAPANPQLNWAYYNSADKKAYIYDGTAWQILAVDGQNGQDGQDGTDGVDGTNGTNGTDGTDGIDGIGITWKGTFASAPANPQLNWAYYNSADKKAYIYNGTAWQILAVDGQNGQDGQDGIDGVDGTNGTNGTDGADGIDGIGITWKGTSTSAPANPQLNWAYYNSADKKAYIYDGAAWQILAVDGQNGQDGQNGTDGVDGTDGAPGNPGSSIVWKGEHVAAPTNPVTNWIYYNMVDRKSYIYDGVAWQILTQDGTGIVWKGELASAPLSPVTNWAYYNTTTRKAYIFDGGAWQIMVQSALDLTGTVSISGTPQVGQTLTAITTGLGGGGAILYQWIRGVSEGIPGANSSTYKPVAADVGQIIKIQVSRAGYIGEVISGATAAVADLPALTGTVSISGSAQVGQILRALTTNLGGSGVISYQWIRGLATEILGETAATYIPTPADVDATIKVRVSRAGNSGTVTSSATATTVTMPPTYTTIAELSAFLSGESSNTVLTPITVAYTGNENLSSLYSALETAGRYVDLDLSGSSVTGFAYLTSNTEPGRSRIVSLVLPNTLTAIPAGTSSYATFNYFSNLKSVSGANVLTVGSYAFRNLSSLSSVSLPAVKTINSEAFYGCTSLSSVSLPDVRAINSNAFVGCTSLRTINLPEATTIGDSAFSSCISLETANLPKVNSIGASAFSGCTSLESVNLPAVTSIGNSAFQSCTSLASITFGATGPSIPNGYSTPSYGMFYNIPTKNITLYVPAGKTSVYLAWMNNHSGNYSNCWGNVTLVITELP